MHVEFWAVGASSSLPLSFTADEVSAHLLADWLPTRPPNVARAIFGWPQYLLEPHSHESKIHHSILREAGGSERQWKGVISWMLGIAATRHVLQHEGYLWVAPLSAFYASATHPVTLGGWPSALPPGPLVASSAAASTSRLRPDYLAIRPTAAGGFELAAAESKGTTASLTKMSACPANWYDQARNVKLALNGAPLALHRHVVVATRVNPNAVRTPTRRLQVRAWNSEVAAADLPAGAVLEIVTAHLYGLFVNFHMRDAAEAVFDAADRLTTSGHRGQRRRVTRAGSRLAGINELRARVVATEQGPSLVQSITTEDGEGAAFMEAPVFRLAERLVEAATVDEAFHAIRHASQSIAAMRRGRSDGGDPKAGSMLRVTVPPRRDRR